MQITPLAVGKIAGAAIILALIVLVIVWVQADYAIKGTIVIDTGTGMRPASQVDVRLIDSSSEQEIAAYLSEYEALKQDLLMAGATQLFDRLGQPDQPDQAHESDRSDEEVALTIENLIDGSAPLNEAELSAEQPELQRVVRELNRTLDPLTEEERTQVTARVQKYLEYALYCRKQKESALVGQEYYERAAQFWENRATRLKEIGRLLIDDAQPSYETSWLPYAGLGDEPSQQVRTVLQSDKRARVLAAEQAAEGARSGAKKSPADTRKQQQARAKTASGGVLPGAPVTSNEIMDIATRIQQRLRQQRVSVLKRSDEKLLALTVQQEVTDEEGHFAFEGQAIQPGEFLLFARYDMLTTDGEQVEFMWFEPVAISLRRFAFDKSTEVALDEMNQRQPACLELEEPGRDELFSEIVALLSARRERSARDD
jgi:hypothetical protein